MEESLRTVRSSGEPVGTSFLAKHPPSPIQTLTKILLVQFRNGEAVDRHPELRSLIEDGWSIRSAVPRIVESEGARLLVVLARASAGTRAAVTRSTKRTLSLPIRSSSETDSTLVPNRS